MSTVFEVLPLFLSFSLVALAWQSWRNLSTIQRELERHARGREIKRRVLAEVAKQKAVQP